MKKYNLLIGAAAGIFMLGTAAFARTNDVKSPDTQTISKSHAVAPGIGLSVVKLVGKLGAPEQVFYIHKEKGADGLMIIYIDPPRLYETDGRGIVDRAYGAPGSLMPSARAAKARGAGRL
jgi:hypothetical protein